MAKKEKDVVEKITKKKTTEKKEVVKKKVTKKAKVKKEKTKLIHNISNELSKVKWPTGKEIAKYTLVTILFCLALIGFFLLINALSTLVRGLF